MEGDLSLSVICRETIRLLTTVEKQQYSCGRETAVKSVKNPRRESPKPTPLTEREHVGGWSRGKCPDPAPLVVVVSELLRGAVQVLLCSSRA